MIDHEDYDICNELCHMNTSYIYGEVDNESLQIVFDKHFKESMDLYSFIDIGSGCGRLCTFLQSRYNFFVYGVEVDRKRYEKSIKNDAFSNGLSEILCDDFRNLYFGNYDILYCCNTVFSDEDNESLFTKIVKEFRGICFLFDYNHILMPYYKEEFVIKTSWSKNTYLYMFQL